MVLESIGTSTSVPVRSPPSTELEIYRYGRKCWEALKFGEYALTLVQTSYWSFPLVMAPQVNPFRSRKTIVNKFAGAKNEKEVLNEVTVRSLHAEFPLSRGQPSGVCDRAVGSVETYGLSSQCLNLAPRLSGSWDPGCFPARPGTSVSYHTRV
ncbi:hypothetical protein EDB85DRAFT_1957126 [Lactarius pseudohatsudake]|nr:hypothetical protein EDB85DRAFT_1957126 [Lactarius pseudohatsudake]